MTHDFHEGLHGYSPAQVLHENNGTTRDRCAIDGCPKPRHCRDLCSMHYTRWKRHGDALFAMGRGFARTALPTYRARHTRVTKVRGAASLHACVHCGDQAREWATIHGRDGLAPIGDYVPLCHRCHQRYDRQHLQRARGSANGKALLNERQVLEIKQLLAEGTSTASIARRFGRHYATIDSIRRGRTWAHVS